MSTENTVALILLTFQATGVELLINVLHHKYGAAAPASISETSSNTESTDMGEVPHQIRGLVPTFSSMRLTGQSFNCCVGCGELRKFFTYDA